MLASRCACCSPRTRARSSPAGRLLTPRSGTPPPRSSTGGCWWWAAAAPTRPKELASVELWSQDAPLLGGPEPVGGAQRAHRDAAGRRPGAGGGRRDARGHDAGVHLEALRSTRLFDPRTNRWSPGPALLEANRHTATLLPGGEVLVVGGAREQKTHLASVELYTPDGGFSARPLPRRAVSTRRRWDRRARWRWWAAGRT